MERNNFLNPAGKNLPFSMGPGVHMCANHISPDAALKSSVIVTPLCPKEGDLSAMPVWSEDDHCSAALTSACCGESQRKYSLHSYKSGLKKEKIEPGCQDKELSVVVRVWGTWRAFFGAENTCLSWTRLLTIYKLYHYKWKQRNQIWKYLPNKDIYFLKTQPNSIGT